MYISARLNSIILILIDISDEANESLSYLSFKSITAYGIFGARSTVNAMLSREARDAYLA